MQSSNSEQSLKKIQIKLIDSIDVLESDALDDFIPLLEDLKSTAHDLKLWGFNCFIEEIINFYKDSQNKLTEINSIGFNKKKIIELSLDSLLEYTRGISNGFYDIPVFYLVTLDLLRYNLDQDKINTFSLYTQSSFFLKSIEKNNISGSRCSFSATQRMNLINNIEFLEYFYDFNFTVKDYDYQKAIKSCFDLTTEFKGTQHEVLWNFCYIIFNFLEKGDFEYLDRLFFTYIFNDVIRNYSSVLETMSFEKIECNINKTLSSLSYIIQKYSNRDFIDRATKQKLISLIRMPQNNTLNSIINFRNHIDFKELSVITLDFYSELDLVVSNLLEDNKKKSLEVSEILNILNKQKDSFVIFGYYQYWFEYTKAIEEISGLLCKESNIDSKNFEKFKDIIFNLLDLISDLQKSENNMDNLPFCLSSPEYKLFSETQVQDAEIISQETLKEQSNGVTYDNPIITRNNYSKPSTIKSINPDNLKEMSERFAKLDNHILMLEKVVSQLNFISDSVDSSEIRNAINFISENTQDVHDNIKKEIGAGSKGFHRLYEEVLENQMLDSVKSLLGSSAPQNKIKVMVYQLNHERSKFETEIDNLRKNFDKEIKLKITLDKDSIQSDIESYRPNLIILETNKTSNSLMELFDLFSTISFSKSHPIIVTGDNFTKEESQAIVENGASVYLQKPYNVNKFIKIINLLTKGSSSSKSNVQIENKSLEAEV